MANASTMTFDYVIVGAGSAGRRNLQVETRALARRVRIENGRAVGVDYLQGGREFTAMAAREVILAGGVYASPQLLMLSGVGPAAALNSLGIRPLNDLPGVGKNLIEHPFMFVGWNVRPGAFRSELRLDRAAQSDVDRAIRGLRAIRDIYGREPLRGLVGDEALPGATLTSDADLERFTSTAPP